MGWGGRYGRHGGSPVTPLYVRVFDADGMVVAKGEASLEAQPDGLVAVGWVVARRAVSGDFELHAFGPRFSIRVPTPFPAADLGDRVDICVPVTVGDASNTTYAAAQTAQAQANAHYS